MKDFSAFQAPVNFGINIAVFNVRLCAPMRSKTFEYEYPQDEPRWRSHQVMTLALHQNAQPKVRVLRTEARICLTSSYGASVLSTTAAPSITSVSCLATAHSAPKVFNSASVVPMSRKRGTLAKRGFYHRQVTRQIK